MTIEEMFESGKYAQENYGIASGGERAIANLLDKLDEADIDNLLYYYHEHKIVELIKLYVEERK